MDYGHIMNPPMPRLVPLLWLIVLLAAVTPTHAGAETVRAAAVVDGDTLRLEDGRVLRLSGIDAPRPPAGADPARRWPLAEGAAALLGDLTAGQPLSLAVEVAEDRYGRVLAQVTREDGLWIQGEMLRRGLARVQTRADAHARTPEMLAVEAEARAARRGLWRTRAYAVRDAADTARLSRDRDSFQVVEGTVMSAAKVKNLIYLNFGSDWREDTTVSIDSAAAKACARAGLDPLALQGRMVRVRGWVTERNGPMIAVTHPEQIERIDVPSNIIPETE